MLGFGGDSVSPVTGIIATWGAFVYLSAFFWPFIGVWIGVPSSLWYIWKHDRHWSYWAAVAGSIALVLLFGGPRSEYEWSGYVEMLAAFLSAGFVMSVMVVASFRHARKGAICGLVLHVVLVALCLFSLYEGSTLQRQSQDFVLITLNAGIWSIVLGALAEVLVRRIKSIKVNRVDTRNISIANAYSMEGCRVHLLFSDGHETNVDFGPFLLKSGHPDVQKYLDANTFRHFTVRKGDLMWGDYDMIFPVADLYAGRV